MIATNEKSNCSIFKDITNKKLGYKPNDLRMFEHEDYIGQHLYITSSEEIKEGDWCLVDNNILQWKKNDNYQMLYNCKKIIATTDKSLTIITRISLVEGGIKHSCNRHDDLPQPSKSFIKAYIEAYNNGNPITKVNVEYEVDYSIDCHESVEECQRFPHNKIDCEECIKASYKLKVNQSNEITIKNIKDTYSKEEVETLIRQWASFTVTGRGQWWKPNDLDKWIEKNV
jgi:PIN domain nuclease of toxin-antitoxin system